VADVDDPWAKLLFTWMIPTVDNCGRMEGEPYQVKGLVFPLEPTVSPEQVAAMLQKLHDRGLIIWYQHGRLRYIYLPRFQRHQKLVGNMRATSDFPEPSSEDIEAWNTRTNAVHTTYVPESGPGIYAVSTEVEVEVEVEEEGGLGETPLRRLVSLARTTIPDWKPNGKDEATIAAALTVLPEHDVERVIHQLAIHQAANGKYKDMRGTLANWLKREKPTVQTGAANDAREEAIWAEYREKTGAA